VSKLETLLREALSARSEASEALLADLRAATREASEAVESVTDGAASLKLIPLDPLPGLGEAFGLALRWNQDDRIIRVFEFSPNGARIKLFGSLLGWRERRDARATVRDRAALDPLFTDLVSARDSDVVTMLRFIIGNTPKQPADAA